MSSDKRKAAATDEKTMQDEIDEAVEKVDSPAIRTLQSNLKEAHYAILEARLKHNLIQSMLQDKRVREWCLRKRPEIDSVACKPPCRTAHTAYPILTGSYRQQDG